MDFIRINLPETLIEWLPPVAMVASVIALGVILAVVMRRKEARLHQAQRELAATLDRASAHRREVEEAHVKSAALLGAIQRLSLRLEERMLRFEQELSERSAAPRRTAPAPKPSLVHQGRPPAARATDDAVTASALSTTAVAAASGSTAPGRSPTASATMEAKPAVDPATQMIYELADQGRAAIDIARELDEHIGKVELILALRAHATPA